MIIFGGIKFPEECGECEHHEVCWDGEMYAKCNLTQDYLVFNADDTRLRFALDCRPNTCPYNEWFEIVRKVLDNVVDVIDSFDIISGYSDVEELKRKITEVEHVRN